MVKSIAFSLCAMLLLSESLFSQIGGSVDWVNRVVKVKGIGAPNPALGAAGRPAAIRAAKQVALRDALELIKGIPLNSQTTIANSMVESDVINSSVSGFMQGFQFEESPHYMSDGTVEIEVTVPIDGANGLSNQLFGGSVNLVGEKPTATFSGSGKGAGFSGLIIDATGLQIKPALMPKILDESDKEIYGSAFVTREFAVKYGMCGYVKSIENAKKQTDRIGTTPCMVKAVKASGPNKADLVLSKQDADQVRNAANNMKFLSECRVIVVLN
ncbi:MAG: hypothetical protein A2293_00450 [Elusimicrobia bacterium RIFOXYB2_FULL_49_7]|nr:MAG: hypothetical protein A2293_00450 [Elusimicrobia bacterium RIFOXYB2_FULL_49_7]